MQGRIIPRWTAGAIAAFATLSAAAPAAPTCAASSGASTTALVELYTSEGCSSCPPADRWLSALKTSGVVPLALHVDYWDYLGWPDRYADSRFSQRQREAVSRGRSRVVYTPQAMLDGRDFPQWHNGTALERALKEVAARPPQARLELKAIEQPAGAWSVELGGQVLRPHGRAEAYLALYENDLQSDVRAGENKGARLEHDYVVRQWVGPVAVGSEGKIALTREFPRRAGIDFGKAGVAGFVQDPDTGQVLQAIALRLCQR